MKYNEEIEALLAGKGTEIGKKIFLPTEEYVIPFVEALSTLTNDFRVQTVSPKQITYSTEAQDTTYNRVWIQGVLPDMVDNHQQVIGMLYGLDAKNSPMKFYKGLLNAACTNLCVFNPEALSLQEVVSQVKPNFAPLLDLVGKEFNEHEILNKLRGVRVSKADAGDHLKAWVDYVLGTKSCPITPMNVIKAYEDVFKNPKSKYFKESIGYSDVSAFTIYNAFTQQLTNAKNFLNRAEATLRVQDLMGLDDM